MTASRSIRPVSGWRHCLTRGDSTDLVLVPTGAELLTGGVQTGEQLDELWLADVPCGDRPELGHHGVGIGTPVEESAAEGRMVKQQPQRVALVGGQARVVDGERTLGVVSTRGRRSAG